MQIDYQLDPSVQNAPSGFLQAAQQAANIIDRQITNDITVTLDLTYQPLGPGMIAEANPTDGAYVDYATLKNALAAAATSQDDMSFIAGLPAADPSPSGNSRYFVSRPEAEALNLPGVNRIGADGTVSVNSLANFSFDPNNIGPGQTDLVGTLLHEDTHALGRYLANAGPTVISLTAYGSNGAIDTSPGPEARLFSINRGQSLSAQYNGPSDAADFTSTPYANDPFQAYLSPGVAYNWTPFDTQVMDVLGWNVAGQQPPPAQPSPPQSAYNVSALQSAAGQVPSIDEMTYGLPAVASDPSARHATPDRPVMLAGLDGLAQARPMMAIDTGNGSLGQ